MADQVGVDKEVTSLDSALITGASGEIGSAIALQLARDYDFHLLLHYHNNTQKANELMNQLIAEGHSCELIQFDVSNYSEVIEVLSNWQANNEDAIISTIVNNAGIKEDGLLMWMKEEDWDKVVDVSLKGMYNVTRQLIQPMLKNRFGRIVNIASLSGVKGVPGQVNYSAAKGGLIAATKALAQEVAKRNITVNAVAPGFISSEMTENQNNEMYKNLIPMGRFGEPAEVADLVSFLVSKKAAYITGEVININGGIYS